MNRINIAQQVSQRDAPPVGGFETQFLIKVRWLRFAFVGGAPLTVTLGVLGKRHFLPNRGETYGMVFCRDCGKEIEE